MKEKFEMERADRDGLTIAVDIGMGVRDEIGDELVSSIQDEEMIETERRIWKRINDIIRERMQENDKE